MYFCLPGDLPKEYCWRSKFPEGCLKLIPEPKQRKISVYIDSCANSLTHGVANCPIRTIFWHTCSTKSKYKISARKLQYMMILAVFWLMQWIPSSGFYTCFLLSKYVKILFWYYSLPLHGLVNWHNCQYIPIFCVVWVLVLILGNLRETSIFSSIPLVIPQVRKFTLILALL